MLVNLATLTPTMRGALRRLVAEITEHDGISPINESASLGIDGLRDADFFFLGRRSDPHGFVVCDERESTLQVGVHPQHRRQGDATELLAEALRSYPTFSAWAFGTLPGAPELARRVGLVPTRELLRMERGLSTQAGRSAPEPGSRSVKDDTALLEPVPGAERPDRVERQEAYEIGPFMSADREQVVAVNAAAFAHHPEQGRLTVEEFDQLAAQDWFDPGGLFVAHAADGEVAGFHWTKRHGGGLGEVYVIAVAPGHEGKGLGRALLDRGLDHLAAVGDTRVQLYVEASEQRVVRLYRNAGFDIAQTDTSYQAPREVP
ncbi:MAG TPA: mycothiol synthase [Arachnia sp.]|nr:mycothiol synthase [Arachnia sp.]